MDIYLDNDRFETEAATLGGMIEAASEAAADRGRIVVEVRVDGQTLSAEQLDEQHPHPPTAREVQLISAEPRELSRQTMLEARDALARARQQQAEAAEQLQADDPAAALEQIREALATWSQARQAVDLGARMTGLDLNEIEVDGVAASQIIADLADLLSELKDQLGASDWIGLADTLAYPLTDAARQWEQMIDVLSETIKGR